MPVGAAICHSSLKSGLKVPIDRVNRFLVIQRASKLGLLHLLLRSIIFGIQSQYDVRINADFYSNFKQCKQLFPSEPCAIIHKASFSPQLSPMPFKGLSFAYISPQNPDSIPGQSIWDLWWTKWQWNRFLSECLFFPSYYHANISPYSFIHMPPTPYDLGKWECRWVTQSKE